LHLDWFHGVYKGVDVEDRVRAVTGGAVAYGGHGQVTRYGRDMLGSAVEGEQEKRVVRRQCLEVKKRIKLI
jgi:hypothetical protein